MKKRQDQNKQEGKHAVNNLIAPVSTKESNGKQFRFDDKKVAAPYMQSTKLKNFLVHAGNNNKKNPEPLAIGSFNKREGAMRTGGRLNELLANHNNNNISSVFLNEFE